MRVMGAVPGLSPEEYCAQVWHLPGLLAVNTPRPDSTESQLCLFLLFATEADALAARHAILSDTAFSRAWGAETGIRLSEQRGNRFRYWVDSGTPAMAVRLAGRKALRPPALLAP